MLPSYFSLSLDQRLQTDRQAKSDPQKSFLGPTMNCIIGAPMHEACTPWLTSLHHSSSQQWCWASAAIYHWISWFPLFASIIYEFSITDFTWTTNYIPLSQVKQRYMHLLFPFYLLWYVNQTHFKWFYTSWHNKRNLENNLSWNPASYLYFSLFWRIVRVSRRWKLNPMFVLQPRCFVFFFDSRLPLL